MKTTIVTRRGEESEDVLTSKTPVRMIRGSGQTSFHRSITSKKRSNLVQHMGRTRTKSKLQRQVPPKPSTASAAGASSSTTPSIPALISKAQSIIEQCDYELASQFIQRILQISPKNVDAREMLGVVQLEMGLVQEAREVGPGHFFPSCFFSELAIRSTISRLLSL